MSYRNNENFPIGKTNDSTSQASIAVARSAGRSIYGLRLPRLVGPAMCVINVQDAASASLSAHLIMRA